MVPRRIWRRLRPQQRSTRALAPYIRTCSLLHLLDDPLCTLAKQAGRERVELRAALEVAESVVKGMRAREGGEEDTAKRPHVC